MIFPVPPQKGQPVRAELIKQIIDCLRMFRPINGLNIRTKVTPGGTIINGTPGGGTNGVFETSPFTVRYHLDQWEIYIPEGSVNVGGACDPINAAASSAGNEHEGEDTAWRILYLDENSGATSTDAENNTYRQWNIEIHVKTSAKMYGVDGLDKPARRLVWACTADTLKVNVTDADLYANTPGDSWSCVVASVRVTYGKSGAEPARRVTQLRKVPVDVADNGLTLQGFSLVWYFSIVDGALRVDNLYCVRQLLAVAGMGVTGDQMTDVRGASSVFARIDTKDMSEGDGIISVVADPDENVTTISGDLVTWLPLYNLTYNTVTGDFRNQSLNNVQLYRG